MDSIIENLKLLISNAKKSFSRPYSSDTITDKKSEINTLEKNFSKLQTTEVQKAEFQKLKTEALNVLEQHSEKKTNLEKRKAICMANMEINELTAIVKLVPLFNGKKDELHNFITNLNTVSKTIPVEKRSSFFDFIFNSRLDLKVQNRIKQTTVPTTTEELISALKNTYKPVKNSNSILNELTSIKQHGDNLMGFALKIESLVAELNELQVAEEGEASRTSIIKTNGRIAYNSFLNGLSDHQIVSTIDASRVTTFSEALEIAERSSSRIKQRQVFFQNSRPNQNRSNDSYKCRKCGRSHGNKCPAEGKECHKCKKLNHFGNMCRTGSNESGNNRSNNNNSNYWRNNGNSNNRNTNNNNNQRNNSRNGNNRSRNINQIENQGNSQNPETIHQGSPEELE